MLNNIPGDKCGMGHEYYSTKGIKSVQKVVTATRTTEAE
jgi:hypothetical protein